MQYTAQYEVHYHAVSQNSTLQGNKMDGENIVNILETHDRKWWNNSHYTDRGKGHIIYEINMNRLHNKQVDWKSEMQIQMPYCMKLYGVVHHPLIACNVMQLSKIFKWKGTSLSTGKTALSPLRKKELRFIKR